MSYNYYCYGQIKNKDGKWVEFSKHPLADNLKYYIDFDEVPECFERTGFGDKIKNDDVADYFKEHFKELGDNWDAYVVPFNKYVEWCDSKIAVCYTKLNAIAKCMGLDVDENIWNSDEVIYTLQERNEGQLSKKSVPIAKFAIIDFYQIVINLEKYTYLRSIAKVFESMEYDSHDWDNEKKSFLIVYM